MTKFNIGDMVYLARAEQTRIWITCPECCGSGRLRVVLGDNSEVSIACVCCERGYEGSPGKIQTWAFKSSIEPIVISGIEAHQKDTGLVVRYSSNCWSIDEDKVFATLYEAEARAVVLVQEYEAEEKNRLGYKEKQHKTWAWNVRYWRGEIRQAKETIARCEARLAVAPKNPKETDKQEA